MPATAVYLVKFFWMASMPACLMCSGVVKWGSPAPKSTRSTPCERSVVASLLMAMVAEISMRPMRAVNAVAPAVDDTGIPFRLRCVLCALGCGPGLQSYLEACGRIPRRARSRLSTDAGTRSPSAPPSEAISRTSRELR